VKSLLWEGLLVAATGAALAFAANALSPYRLSLAKDYFPADRSGSPVAAPSASHPNPAGAKTNAPLASLPDRLHASGLQLADVTQVSQLFHDPRRQQDWVIFIDARDDEHYQAGHIPSAYHFDRFHPENDLSNVVQPCLTAQKIVFYCNGGDCDASEQAAIILRDSLTLSPEKVLVYGGGINEWMTNGLPIELGERNSGRFTNGTNSASAPGTEGSK
jgi:rhodanese-related sulfurtransferase